MADDPSVPPPEVGCLKAALGDADVKIAAMFAEPRQKFTRPSKLETDAHTAEPRSGKVEDGYRVR